VKFEQKRIKTPCSPVPVLRAKVPHSQIFIEYPQILQTICAEENMYSGELNPINTENKAKIKNPILVGVLRGFYISSSN
jgi:hypothetical protein